MLFSIPSTLLAAALLLTPDDTLQTAVVVADRGCVAPRTDTLEVGDFRTVTDLLLQCPGVLVQDNGGLAGLKTVSIGGMGSPHTEIRVDGVRVGNVQSGQGDIGVLCLSNCSSAVVDYARSRVSFVTAKPSFGRGRRTVGRASLAAGSFGTVLPSVHIDRKLSDRTSLSTGAEAVSSRGDFAYGDGLRRSNNDISQIKGGLDLFGTLDGGDWHAKASCNFSDRGAPGPVSSPSDDRQSDRNASVQGVVRRQFKERYHLTASARLSYDGIGYTSAWGDSRYAQGEAQLNSTHTFVVCRWLDLAVTADLFGDRLNSTAYDRTRLGVTGETSAAFRTGRFKADASIRYDGVSDSGRMDGWNCLSPSLDFKFAVSDCLEAAGYARRAYRVPTFNELYYTGYGNPDLAPEDAVLTGAGVGWKKSTGRWHLKAGADVFHNFLRDKITSAPTPEDPNVWRPYNVGRVRSTGFDVTAGAVCRNASFSARYCFQDAVDVTSGSSTYGQQMAYIARHSLSLAASARVGSWRAVAAWNLRAGRRDSYGTMPDWNTLDLSADRTLYLGATGEAMLKVSLKNVTDCRYELVSGYPMPGFNATCGAEYRF